MNSSQVTISNLQAGVFKFQVTVTDNLGLTSTASMILTVDQGSSTANKVVVYPNPVHEWLHAKITSSVTGTVKIYIYDMNGRLVLSTETQKSDDVTYKTMNVSLLAPGMYTILVNIANQTSMVNKFIKN
jgi:hypothetical protein